MYLDGPCFALPNPYPFHLFFSFLSALCLLSLSLFNHTVNQIKENVLLLPEEECQLHTLPCPFHLPFLTFLFLLFISTRRSTTHSRHHSPRIPLATPTCKPPTLSVTLPPPNRPYPRLSSFSAIISQPSHPELTGLLQPIINFSSPSNKHPTLQPIFYQWSPFSIYPTTATATPTASRPITITSPLATTTTPTYLSMVRTSPEPSTSYFSQQECSPIRSVAISISPLWSCTSRFCHSRR